VRCLESFGRPHGAPVAGDAEPICHHSRVRVPVVDRLITNFHLAKIDSCWCWSRLSPESSRCGAPTGTQSEERYRFYSYGDAMLVDKYTGEIHRTCDDGPARAGTLELSRGSVETPVFMPVALYGAVKAVSPAELAENGTRHRPGNTFHLWLRPGLEVSRRTAACTALNRLERPVLPRIRGIRSFQPIKRCRPAVAPRSPRAGAQPKVEGVAEDDAGAVSRAPRD